MEAEEKRYCIARLKHVEGLRWSKVVISDWSVTELMAATDLSEYRFFIFQTIDLTTERGDGIMTCRTTLLQESGKFFIHAFVEEYADVLVNNRELAERMTNLGWTHIARSIDKCWTEVYDPELDQLIEIDGA